MIISKKGGILTGAEIKALYEVEENAYTDTKDGKLTGVEACAEMNIGEEFDAAEQAKLAGIAEGAEVNVGEVFTTAEKAKVSNIEYEASEILQLEKLAEEPSTPTEGDMYYDTVGSTYKRYNGSTWESVGISVLVIE